MPASSNPYRPLPGRGGAGLERHRLWLGSDHVLSVASSTIGERYRRFYFADIQALVWRPTAAWWVRAVLWLLLCVGSGLGIASAGMAGLWLTPVCALFLTLLIVELALGKTCACFVKTAVQFERLPSLARQRTVGRVLAQLRPLIEQAQARR